MANGNFRRQLIGPESSQGIESTNSGSNGRVDDVCMITFHT